MSNELWRWADPSGQQRRVKLDELRSALADGMIAANTPVWKPGWKGWRSAQDVPELAAKPAAANGNPIDIPPPPLAVLAVQHDFEAEADRASHVPGDEPPSPPKYVPLPTKGVSTVIGGSAVVVGKSVPPPQQKGSAIPTQIGLPPPPQMKALVEEYEKKQPPLPRRKQQDDIEELSGSVLLDDGTSSRVIPPAGEVTDLEIQIGARRDPRWMIQQLKSDIAEMRARRPPKNKGLVIVAGAFALCVLIMFLAIMSSIIGAITGGSSDKTVASASASASAPTPPAVATTADPAPTQVAPPKEEPKPAAATMALGDCTSAGDAKLIAPRAVISGGIEASATPEGLAVGYAATPRDGVAFWFDTAQQAKAHGVGGDVRRVTPMVIGGRRSALTDVDRKGDRIQLRRAVASGSIVDVGVADNAIVWAPHGTSNIAKLFDLEGEGTVEALRVVPLSSTKGVALAFRRGGAVYVGAATGDANLEAKGGLARIAGLGQVGVPSVAASGEAVMVAWADRAAGQDDWQVRLARMNIGDKPGDATTFAIPDGGLGVQAMSPALTSLGGGRFLLAWTEGPVANHQVRAIAIGADGKSSGSALAISANGVNAGQPQAAVTPDGKGLVAFLAAKGKAYEVHATPIACSK